MNEQPHTAKESTQPRYILALDGGGMRGIVPAVLIHQISELLVSMGDERPFYSHFDLIAGTSTGALLALTLTAPIERTRLQIEDRGPSYIYAPENPTFWQRLRKAKVEPTRIGTLPWGIDTASLERLYRDHGRTIFPKSQSRIIGQIFVDKYDEAPLEQFLQETFGDIALSEAVVPTLIMSYDTEEGRPFSMISSDSHEFLFWEAARASSAAPTFFKPAFLQDRTLGRQMTLIDGGVVANNPSLYAYIEAKRLYPRAQSYHILSLSTASSDFSFKVGEPAPASWGGSTRPKAPRSKKSTPPPKCKTLTKSPRRSPSSPIPASTPPSLKSTSLTRPAPVRSTPWPMRRGRSSPSIRNASRRMPLIWPLVRSLTNSPHFPSMHSAPGKRC